MVFSSLFFLYAFLPACMVIYYFCKTIRTKNICLLIFSLIFYAWGEPVYVVLLLGMSFFSWLFSRQIEKTKNPDTRLMWLILSTVVCIGTIGYFKYAGFFVENINGLAGKEVLAVPNVALPIGISFYTFQLLTYVVDVYRGEVPAQKSYYHVLLYAGLFHQCVAGPIVRYGDIEKEITSRTVNIGMVERGITRFVFGLGKKAIFANGCGAIVETMLLTDAQIESTADFAANLASLQSASVLTMWAGMAFYMLQIYLDFSAYSDMAIGMGLMCGFHYKENFNYPYMSLTITDFWRRWHMSLGTFFRDYVYIPLGGNRRGKGRQIFNSFVVWALTGLWHGASWNFVIWGLYFFVLLMLEKFVIGAWLERHRIISRIYLLATVYFGWIFFRYTNMAYVGTIFKGLFGLNGNPFTTFTATNYLSSFVLFFFLAVLACTPVWKNLGTYIRKNAGRNGLTTIAFRVGDVAVPLAILVLASLALVGDSYNAFMYFRF